ncbi:MAG: hypothetical protein ACOCXG_02240 [Nanoarchaeota archaeon]
MVKEITEQDYNILLRKIQKKYPEFKLKEDETKELKKKKFNKYLIYESEMKIGKIYYLFGDEIVFSIRKKEKTEPELRIGEIHFQDLNNIFKAAKELLEKINL